MASRHWARHRGVAAGELGVPCDSGHMARSSRTARATVVTLTAVCAVTMLCPSGTAATAAAAPSVGRPASGHAGAGAVTTPRSGGLLFTGPARLNGQKVIYLTFDDGPAATGTLQVLAALRANKVKATFFALGGLTSMRTGRGIVSRLHAAGMPIAMHSWSHPNMARWSTAAVRSDLARTSAAIRAATGEVPTCFRPPYGAFGRGVTSGASARHSRVALWDIDPRDWTNPGSVAVANRVISRLHPGAIVLMHDGAGHGRQAAAAIPRIVRAARARGYTFGTLCPMDVPRPAR